jgi:hypothetical protein
MELTREQTQKIIDNGKAQGLDTKKILDGLISRGYNIEGIDTEAAKAAIARETPAPEQTRGEETVADIKQVGTDVVNAAKERSSNVGESIEAMNKGEQGLGRTFLQTIGQGAGLVSDTIGAGIKGVVKTVLPQDAEDATKGVITEIATPIMQSKTAQDIMSMYKTLDPKTQRDINAVLGAGSLITDVVGGGLIGKGVKAGGSALKSSVKNVVGEVAEGVAKNVDNIAPIVKKTVTALKPPVPTALEATGKVLQGASKDIAPAIKGLSVLDTTGVKTFKELGETIAKKIPELARQVDADLALDTTKKLLKDLVVTGKTTAGKIIKTNPVKKAIEQLSELYTKIGDDVSAANMVELFNRVKKEGLTNLEINNLARSYGEEFGRKAFGKLGEPLTSVNAQLYENTRKALKDLARSGIKGKAAQKADEIMSSLYNTKGLVTRSVEAVNKLQQRINERGLLEKIGHGVTKYADILTGGSIRGLVGGLLPRGAGYKVMNALDIEQALGKNLKIIQDAIKAGNDAEIIKILKKLN